MIVAVVPLPRLDVIEDGAQHPDREAAHRLQLGHGELPIGDTIAQHEDQIAGQRPHDQRIHARPERRAVDEDDAIRAAETDQSIGAASIMVGYFRQGIIGLCLGIMAGRLIMSVGYPVIIGRFLGASFSSQIKGLLRPALVTILLFGAAAALAGRFSSSAWSGTRDWILFIVSANVTGILMLLAAFYAGLSANQRENMLDRVRRVVTLSGSP